MAFLNWFQRHTQTVYSSQHECVLIVTVFKTKDRETTMQNIMDLYMEKISVYWLADIDTL